MLLYHDGTSIICISQRTSMAPDKNVQRTLSANRTTHAINIAKGLKSESEMERHS